MKLRIHQNSLRLRLTQKEVAELRCSGRVDAAICFALDRVLSYSIEMHGEAAPMSVTLDESAIRVSIPTAIATRWADSDDVSIEGSQAVSEKPDLQLLIEKDFQCLHRTAEEPDAYPNPLATLSA